MSISIDTLGRYAGLAAVALVAVLAAGCYGKEETHPMASARESAGAAGGTQVATFAAGCFWGVEARLRQVPGVVDAEVGYTGGTLENPTYEDVCTGRTGHAEAVRVTFDPSRVSYAQLLDAFWRLHDPTTLNRQGPDVGTQYRSAVFYHDAAQEAAAGESKARLAQEGRFAGRRIVTEIVPAATFWRAEEYHPRYVEKHGGDACPLP